MTTSTNPMELEILEGQHLDIASLDVLPIKSVQHLGMGSSASVEMVQLTTNGLHLAHKIFRKAYGQKLDEAKKEFHNEIAITKRLSPHHHIVRVFATYTCGRTLGMLLTPVASGDLATYLQTIQDSGLSTTPEQTAILDRSFGCLANGLAFIHKHTIRHKDIKPHNILIHNGRVLYTDFGISLDASQQEDTSTTGNPGAFTRRYCALEVARWEKRNRKSDVFSLACVFVEVLAVLELQVPLKSFQSRCYWEAIDDLRDILLDTSTHLTNRSPLFRICYEMLEPNCENRLGAETLLDKIYGLWETSSDLRLKYFCRDCAPKPDPQDVDSVKRLHNERYSISWNRDFSSAGHPPSSLTIQKSTIVLPPNGQTKSRYFCTYCYEHGIVILMNTKQDWKRHQLDNHYTGIEWRCPETGCLEVFYQKRLFRRHQSKDHLESGALWLNYRDTSIQQARIYACGFTACERLSATWRLHCDHISNHMMMGDTEWSYDWSIHNLLNQETVLDTWKKLSIELELQLDIGQSQLKWNPQNTAFMKQRLESQDFGSRLEDFLRELFFAGLPR
jgi:serine/threonine protein kinase